VSALIIAGALVVIVILRRPLADTGDAILAFLDDFLERRGGGALGRAPMAAVLLAPTLIILGVFGVAPLFYALYMSLFDYKKDAFVGLSNYAKALTHEDFWNSFLVTSYYAAFTIPLTMLVSYLVAHWLYRTVRGRGLFRTVYFLPYVTSIVAAATVWRVILRPQQGLANDLVGLMGVPPQQWLLEPRGILSLITAGLVPPTVGPGLDLFCIILFEIWHSSGFMIVIFLAGLTAIPKEFEEAARIDGAGSLQVVRHVTLPLLSPTIFFLAVVSLIRSFQAFNSFYALTSKQGGDSTRNMMLYIYSNFYEYGRLGYGAAVATLLSAAIIVFTLIQWRFLGRRVHYE
jgi:ABC-type sugar transport system permease subunit